MNTEKFSAALSAAVFGAAALVIFLGLNISPNYPDFIVGNLTWFAGNKFQDLVVMPAFIIASFLGFTVLSKIILTIRDNQGADVSSSLASQLIWWSIPFYAGVATLFLGGTIELKTIGLSALGIVFLAGVSFLNLRARIKFDPDFLGMAFL